MSRNWFGVRPVQRRKALAEVGRVGEAERVGDLLDAHSGVAQAFDRRLESRFGEQLAKRRALLSELAPQRARSEAQLGGDRREADGPREVGLQASRT